MPFRRFKKTVVRPARKVKKVPGRTIKSLKPLIKSIVQKQEETKYYDVYSVSSAGGGSFAACPFTSMAGGGYCGFRYCPLNMSSSGADFGFGLLSKGTDNLNNYVGDSVVVKAIRVHLEVSRSNNLKNYRIMIVRANSAYSQSAPNTAPVINSLVMNSFQSVADNVCFRPVDNLATSSPLKIVKDVKISWAKVDTAESVIRKSIVLSFPKGLKLTYDDSTGYCLKNQFWMFWARDGDAGNDAGSIKFHSRMYFKDA